MIKKTTKAVFTDGAYKGEYDWQGGIPLAIGEFISVSVEEQTVSYLVIDKSVALKDSGDDQAVHVQYTLAEDK